MNAIFWGGDREGSVAALQYLEDNNVKVIACVCDNLKENGLLQQHCRRLGIVACSAEKLHDIVSNIKVDVGFCYSYHKLIKEWEIKICRHGIINFHPSPLPDHRGVAGCCYAIYMQMKQWGVSAHYVDLKFDAGPIIQVNWFDIPGKGITGIEMDRIVQKEMLSLFRSISNMVMHGKYPLGVDQSVGGNYYSREDMLNEKCIKEDDTLEMINRKIEAFWFPPYHGATIKIAGETFTLVNKTILESFVKNENKMKDK